MSKTSVAIVLSFFSSMAFAQMNPEGLWRNIDDKTGEAKAEIRIAATASGLLNGKIEKALTQGSEPNCSACTDDRKDKPILGMTIVRNMKQDAADAAIWTGGDITDQKNGKVYRARLKPVDGGKTLEVRGYIGPFYRNQTWIRVE